MNTVGTVTPRVARHGATTHDSGTSTLTSWYLTVFEPAGSAEVDGPGIEHETSPTDAPTTRAATSTAFGPALISMTLWTLGPPARFLSAATKRGPPGLRQRIGPLRRRRVVDVGRPARIRGSMAQTEAMAFEEAFPDLYRLAYRVAFRLLGDRGDAEDAAQEALARADVRWHKLGGRPEGWVVTVATNLAIDRIRRRRRPPTTGTSPLALVDAHLPERVDLARALQRLTKRQRHVVVLRYLADRSELEVAETLGCSPGSVKTHASRGLAALRLELGDRDERGGDDARASR